ncbi:hypothetical protein [Sneathiella sp.]|uniref:hypothetical protein n=1 Tax=Sneathiella sp. TaxID=1964365 RepID=UPI002626C6F5|nr:hypothetical protein [Sneathiella sp.]MDF2368868.1 hypothetical protein [Sneathiella sp.]
MKDRDLRARMNAATKAAFDRDARIHEKPVSKLELKAREKRRATPASQNNLTPDGFDVQAVNEAVESENERRIHIIQKRLNRQKDKARNDFTRSR